MSVTAAAVHFGTSTRPEDSWNTDEITQSAVADLIAHLAGVRPAHVVWMEQIHGPGVAVIGSSGSGFRPGIDAAVTDQPSTALTVKSADCAAIFIAGPGVIGVAHAGMSGAVQGILSETLRVLEEKYAAQPGQLSISLGPHICGRCYEMSENNRRFLQDFPDSNRFVRKRAGKEYFQLAALLADQAAKAGVGSFDGTAPCTKHGSDYFSVRRGDGERRHLSYIFMESDA